MPSEPEEGAVSVSQHQQLQTPTLQDIEKMETTFLWYYTLSFLSLASAGRKEGQDVQNTYLVCPRNIFINQSKIQFSSALVKRDTISELTDIGNSIGNSIKGAVHISRHHFGDIFNRNLIWETLAHFFNNCSTQLKEKLNFLRRGNY